MEGPSAVVVVLVVVFSGCLLAKKRPLFCLVFGGKSQPAKMESKRGLVCVTLAPLFFYSLVVVLSLSLIIIICCLVVMAPANRIKRFDTLIHIHGKLRELHYGLNDLIMSILGCSAKVAPPGSPQSKLCPLCSHRNIYYNQYLVN